VVRAASNVGASVGREAIERLTGFVELVSTYNAKIDRTAARGDEELIDLMVADALARGEDLLGRDVKRFDVAISRATLAPRAWLALGAELAAAEVWVLLAGDEPPEISAWVKVEDLRYR
jgi:hypothetical protein